jgi:hypothetical protein
MWWIALTTHGRLASPRRATPNLSTPEEKTRSQTPSQQSQFPIRDLAQILCSVPLWTGLSLPTIATLFLLGFLGALLDASFVRRYFQYY